MTYVPIADPKFLATAESWFHSQPELLVLIRYSGAAGSKAFEFFPSFEKFSERLGQLPHLACVIVFEEPQLPIRGVVDDAFIARCLQNIPEGTEYLVTETVQRVIGQMSWFHHAEGVSHAELREDLEDCRGAPVAAGIYPCWFEDSETAISAVVPDEHGVARPGIY
jgi:hypothetical protein